MGVFINPNAIQDNSMAKDKLNTSLQVEIDNKQEALTLTVKDNGNIVLANIQGQSKEFMPATPSGDPMHYAYVSAGAEYNDTGADIIKTAPWADLADDDADKTVVHKAGYWYLNGLGDITNEQMRKIYGLTLPLQNHWTNFLSGQDVRTNFMTINEDIDVTTNLMTIGPSSFRNSSIEIIRVPTRLTSLEYSITLNLMHASNLKHILGVIKVPNSPIKYGLYSLSTIKVYGLLYSISYIFSKNLSINSVLYMINNEAATSPITITLHADVYNKCMANADISAALEAHPNISLASV